MREKKRKSKGRTKKAAARSSYDLMDAAGLVGCIKGAPKDLSTNQKYFAGFGKSKRSRSRST